MQLFKHAGVMKGSNRFRRFRLAGLAISAAVLMIAVLSGFTKLLTPITTYTGIPASRLAEVYQRAYARVGMTVVSVTTDDAVKNPDGTSFTIKSYSFSYPSEAKRHDKTGGTVFSIGASTRNGICIKCDITRTSYWGDPKADEKATNEIRRLLGKSVPVIPTDPT